MDLELIETKEHRLAPRFAMQVPVEFLLDDGSRLRAFTRDLSANGIFVSLKQPLHPQSYLRFLIRFPEEITSSCKLLAVCDGSIVRREQGKYSEGIAVRIDRFQFLSSIT
jgi:hypothetical protein